jgi:hypothetical protein
MLATQHLDVLCCVVPRAGAAGAGRGARVTVLSSTYTVRLIRPYISTSNMPNTASSNHHSIDNGVIDGFTYRKR